MKKRLSAVEKEIREHEHARDALVEERKTLTKVIRDLDRAANYNGPLVRDETLVKLFQDAGEGVVLNSHEVAAALGVHPRNVARKLRMLVDRRVLLGDPRNGYMIKP